MLLSTEIDVFLLIKRVLWIVNATFIRGPKNLNSMIKEGRGDSFVVQYKRRLTFLSFRNNSVT